MLALYGVQYLKIGCDCTGLRMNSWRKVMRVGRWSSKSNERSARHPSVRVENCEAATLPLFHGAAHSADPDQYC